jgi:oxygen-independent coproporphyrinogen-3 oxidase
MYWEGNREFFAFGCGAASYINKHRFTRPKSVSTYY